MGTAPTHPELLDWLAADFVAGGWRIKRLHKLIMLSTAYRMDSSHPRDEEYAGKDFANERWYRANRRRLEAEALRDAMLSVSGQLNLKAGGPSFFPTPSKEALEGLSKKGAEWGQSPPDEQRRRSIFMVSKRSLLLPLLTVFDASDTTQPCVQRNVSTVAPQALALLNNEFVHKQSTALAQRVEREAGIDQAPCIERAWWLALGRAARDEERAAAIAHWDAQTKLYAASLGERSAEARQRGLASLCHVLLNTNEFIYVD
jgi:hypothetical protein